MSTESTFQSEQSQDQSVEETASQTNESVSKIEDLERRLKAASEEAKRYRQEKAEANKRLQEAEKKKLEEAGEYKTLFEKAQAQLEEEREKSKTMVGNLALNQLKSAFRAEAVKAGCQRPDALEKLVGLDRLAKAMTSNHEVDPVLLKSMIDDSQKEFDFTFAKPAPSLRDTSPGHSKPQAEKSVNEMSISELKAFYSRIA